MTNQANTPDTNEEKPLFEIPKDPKILKELRDGLKKVEDSKVRAASERDFQTVTIKDLVKVTQIPNAVIRKLAGVVADGGVQGLVDEVENLEALYCAINNNLEAQIGPGHGLNPVLNASAEDVDAAIQEALANDVQADDQQP